MVIVDILGFYFFNLLKINFVKIYFVRIINVQLSGVCCGFYYYEIRNRVNGEKLYDVKYTFVYILYSFVVVYINFVIFF